MFRHLRELYQYRALLWSLTQRELKARYRGSVLGFLWTFLNPTLLMLVYSLIFGFFMKQSIPNYTYFMFVGLLPWICFSTTIVAGASTISERRDLLTKVRFPAQVLPATVVGVNLINYLFSLPLMVGLGLMNGIIPTWHDAFFPLVLAVQLLFTYALLLVISALNVAFRDLQHIINNVITLMFFVTPVIYQPTIFPERLDASGLPHWLGWMGNFPMRATFLYANPMSILTTAYQAIFYDHRAPDLLPLGAVALVSLALLWAAASVFEGRREQFAELI